jgi:hypothetical protein
MNTNHGHPLKNWANELETRLNKLVAQYRVAASKGDRAEMQDILARFEREKTEAKFVAGIETKGI